MSVGFQKPKIKSRSAGPGGKKPGTSCHGKNPVSLSIAAIPKDSPPGSSDWVAAKNSGTSSASGGRVGQSGLSGGQVDGVQRGRFGTRRIFRLWFRRLVPPPTSWTTRMPWMMGPRTAIGGQTPRIHPQDPLTGWLQKIPALPPHLGRRVGQSGLSGGQVDGVQRGRFGTRRIFRLWFRQLVPPPTSWTTSTSGAGHLKTSRTNS